MITIAILAAIRSELEPFLALGLGGEVCEVLAARPVYLHQARYLDTNDCPVEVRYALMVCGVGKVRAASATQALIDRYQPDLVINVGTAGALRPDVAIGDIVVTLTQHQHDSQLWERFVAHPHEEISQFIYNELKQHEGAYRVHSGNGCAGDVFQEDLGAKQHLAERFDACCVDMESAAIADVCAVNQVHFCVIRTISDSLTGSQGEFDANYERLSRQVAEALHPLMGKLAIRLAELSSKPLPSGASIAGYRFTGLTTPRLKIRRFRLSDAEILQHYRAQPEVARYQGWEEGYTLTEAQSLVREMAGFDPGYLGTWFQMGIELKETSALIGDIGVHTIAEDPKQVKIGYTLAREYQGQGFATEALSAFLGYLFTGLKKRRVLAYVDMDNQRSIKLLERLGFVREGRLRENSWANGEWRDDYLYALLDHDWWDRKV
ncbi:MAG: GNAT family N-acetyltransferase, partial [Bacillota bacterium]